MTGRSSIRVLVVDDSPADVLLARELLAQSPHWAFEVLECPSQTALETHYLHQLSSFEAVLYGLPLHGASGIRLLRRLCSALEGRPLLLCTEHFEAHQLGPLADAGVQSILLKDLWSVESLAGALVFGIEQARARRSYGLDVLTGLPTRSVWNDRLMHVLDRCRRSGTPFAVMLVDLDDFKRVNDTLGHDAGDHLLRQIAQRLRHSVRQNDTVARLGGDEFAVLLEELPFPDIALQIARKLIADVCVPAHLSRATVPVSISVGVAIVSPNQRQLTSDWVQQAADAALYEAKRAGKRNFSVYTEDMDRALLASLQLDEDVARAVQRNEFSLHYQPVLALGGSKLIGFEALLRWMHGPRQGVTPELFLPVLERIGLMPQIGRAVLQVALQQLGRWRDRTDQPLVMHVNLSASQLRDPLLGAMVSQALDSSGLPAQALVLELPESALINNGPIIEAALRPLRALGVRFAICEFGLGQAMASLHAFRPDYIKLSRRPVQQMSANAVDAAIVRAHLALSRELEIELIAEGVEHDLHLQALLDLGDVRSVQGYLTGAPMLADAIERDYPPYRDLIRDEADSAGASAGPVAPLSGGRLRTSGLG